MVSDNIKVDGWSIYDLPVKYSEADYDEAREEIVDKVRKTPGLNALFEVGCISAPGISDMDFWAVFDDDAQVMHIPSKPILSGKTRHLMMHKIMVIPEKYYRKMLYFDPWTTNAWPNGHRLLWQKESINRDLGFEKISFDKKERDILSAVFLESSSLKAIYSNIPYFVNKEVPIRASLETIKDCVYAIREINLITDKKIDVSFSNEFRELQKNWFEMEEREAIRKFIDVLRKGILIGFEAAFSLADWLKKNSKEIYWNDLKIKKTNYWNRSVLDRRHKNVYLSAFRDKRVFTDSVKNPKQAFDLSVNSYQKIRMNLGWRVKIVDFYIIFQPLEMAGMLLSLANGNICLSNRLKSDIFANQDELPIFQPEIFRKKIEMINELTGIYNRKRRSNSDCKGFTGGGLRFGYLFEREGLNRKVLDYYLKRKFWRAINKLN